MWDRVDFELETLAKLEFEEATRHFEQLEETEPDVAKAVSTFVNRKRSANSFLKTSSPQSQYPDFIDSISAGTQVGNWKLGELLGLGGMGAVYKAERADGVYEHVAAAKIVRIQSEAQRKRFDQERQRLANLEHPAVVRIIDGGVFEDDLSYLIMDFVDGISLDEYLKQNNASEHKILDKVLDVSKAVEYVHRRSILHRDLKPSNVLVTADGQVKLIDFGIASEISDDTDTPRAMTFAYAAPEQLTNNEATIATDIFSLGVLLHKVLLGDLPQRQSDAGVLIGSTKINNELKAVISRAVATSPDDRYGSVSSLIADLERYLNKEPVAAYSNKRSYKFSKFLKRYPAVSVTASALVLALVGGLTSTSLALNSANTERDRAETALEEVQWQYERGSALLLSQQTFSGLLQKAFGDENTEALTETLMAEWEKAYENREEDPDLAASTSYALVSSFANRHDYVSLEKIASEWLKDKVGNQALVEAGQEIYASALYDSRQYEKALPLLRETLAKLEMRKRPAFDRAAAANRIAGITFADEDIAVGMRHVDELILTAERPEMEIQGLGIKGELYEYMGEMEKSFEYIVKSHDVYDRNPEHISPSRPILKARIGAMYLFDYRNLELAESYLSRCTTEDAEALGENGIIGQCHGLLAMVQIELGDYDKAFSNLGKAGELMAKYAGLPPGGSPGIRAVRSEVLMRLGEVEASRKELQGAKDDVLKMQVPIDHPHMHNLFLTELMLDVVEGADKSEVAQKLQVEYPSADETFSNPTVKFMYRRLLESLTP